MIIFIKYYGPQLFMFTHKIYKIDNRKLFIFTQKSPFLQAKIQALRPAFRMFLYLINPFCTGWGNSVKTRIFRPGFTLGSKKSSAFSIIIEIYHAPCQAEKIMMNDSMDEMRKLKVVSTTFLLVFFVFRKESTCKTKENLFISLR